MKDEQFDLILTGLQSDDQGFAQTGVILAERLGLPHATIIMEVQADQAGTVRVKRELEGGWFQWVKMPLPAVLTIQSGINQLRYATLKGIMAAKKKEIRKAAAASGRCAAAEDPQPLRAGEGEEDAAHFRLPGGGRQRAGESAARGSPCLLATRSRRPARPHAVYALRARHQRVGMASAEVKGACGHAGTQARARSVTASASGGGAPRESKQ